MQPVSSCGLRRRSTDRRHRSDHREHPPVSESRGPGAYPQASRGSSVHAPWSQQLSSVSGVLVAVVDPGAAGIDCTGSVRPQLWGFLACSAGPTRGQCGGERADCFTARLLVGGHEGGPLLGVGGSVSGEDELRHDGACFLSRLPWSPDRTGHRLALSLPGGTRADDVACLEHRSARQSSR
jgi:hypothetical protein